MKRIIILTIATILLVYAGMSARELIQKEKTTSKQILIAVSPTPTRENSLLSHTFVIPENKNSSQSDLTLESIGSFNEEIIKEEKTTSQWKLIHDNTILQITTNLNETSPFGSDLEPDVKLISSRLTTNQLYRIKVDENLYFYTDKYFYDSCGQSFCSNGLINIDTEIAFSVFCFSNSEELGNMEYCDLVIQNLKLIN